MAQRLSEGLHTTWQLVTGILIVPKVGGHLVLYYSPVPTIREHATPEALKMIPPVRRDQGQICSLLVLSLCSLHICHWFDRT